jgi:phosphatidylglycerophosphate synthase
LRTDHPAGAPQARSKVKSRERGWARRLAAFLAPRLAPNTISCVSVLFAAFGAAVLVLVAHSEGLERACLLVAAALLIQLRLLANLMDGMVAVENERRQPTGEFFNELPDRFSDSLFIVAAGYATVWGWPAELAWAAAVLALLTEYVRALGGSFGLRQSFAGVIGKPQRMAILTAACIASLLELALGYRGYAFVAALVVIAAGSLHTIWLRAADVLAGLRQRG